jgi:hypothetical protein
LSKVEFEFPVVGATPAPTEKTLFAEALRHHRALGGILGEIRDKDPECHDEGAIAEFVVCLMLVMREHPAKSDAVYAYVRRAVDGKEFLTELASRIIVRYDVEVRKLDATTEIKDVRDAISRVRLD